MLSPTSAGAAATLQASASAAPSAAAAAPAAPPSWQADAHDPLCDLCNDEQAHFWARFAVVDTTELTLRLVRVEQGAFSCFRCMATLLMHVNVEVETTGELDDIIFLPAGESMPPPTQRRRLDRARHRQNALAEAQAAQMGRWQQQPPPLASPESAHPPCTRSRSFMLTEHLCESCGNRLVHFMLQRLSLIHI